MRRVYVGLANTLHDAAIAVVNADGQLVFAEATERYLQNKRAFGLGTPDVLERTRDLLRRYCEPADEVVLAFSWSAGAQDTARRNLAAMQKNETLTRAEQLFGEAPRLVRRAHRRRMWLAQLQMKALEAPGCTAEYEINRMSGWENAAVIRRFYDHHLTHAATACFTSPYGEAACAILDGVGEGGASAAYVYRDGRIERVAVPAPARASSLGTFYDDVCDACGFSSDAGEEWKVMGLAAYGREDPVLIDKLRQMIRIEGLNLTAPELDTLLTLRRDLDLVARVRTQPAIEASAIAFAGQHVFSERTCDFLTNLHQVAPSANLTIGGGCALNSSTNGQILSKTPFKNLHVFCAPADDGNAVGAAMLAYRDDHPHDDSHGAFVTPYLGSIMSSETIQHVRDLGGIRNLSPHVPDAPRRAAELLNQGKIIGWIQGRAEFGPRALGNRSILADPRRADIKEVINARVKFREEFRPFAPSILHEFGPAYFEEYQESPYMERTLRFRADAASRVPGVVHEDRTGRLHTVKREWNERFHDLIVAFNQLTGIPLVLNTSFNVMGKPIVHSVEDVLATFYSSGIDAVFIDDMLIEK